MDKMTPGRRELSRRSAIKAGAAAVAGMAVNVSWVQQGLAQPAAAQPAAPRNVTLVAAPATRLLKPAPSPATAIWGITGHNVTGQGVTGQGVSAQGSGGSLSPVQAPAPVIRMKQGETIKVKLDNKTLKPLSLHWHGLRHANAMDGVGGFTQAPAAPGGSTEYTLTPPDSGSFIYRPMVLGGAGEAQERGLAGMLVVEEREPPQVDHDIALIVDDWLLTPEGQLAPFAEPGTAPDAAAGGRLGNWLTVNGRPIPERSLFAPGARLRLRLANLSNARTLRIRFDNLKAHVIAIDGQPTDTFEPLRSTLPFAPGTRFDILVDLAEEAGASGSITAMVGPGVPLFMAVTEGAPASARRPALPPIGPLKPNPALPPAVRLQDAVRAEMIITGGATANADGKLDLAHVNLATPWQVNGRTNGVKSAEAPPPPLFSVKRGAPVVLRLTNQTIFPQPLHVHGHAFRMLHPLDDGWEPYFLDTIIVPEGKSLQIAFIADNPGKWLVSATVLERFDTGLWSWFEVS